MLKIIISLLISVLLVGCAPQEIQMAPDGKPVPKIYDIKAHTTAQIQFRMLDAVNVINFGDWFSIWSHLYFLRSTAY
jgi:hypothetical protein